MTHKIEIGTKFFDPDVGALMTVNRIRENAPHEFTVRAKATNKPSFGWYSVAAIEKCLAAEKQFAKTRFNVGDVIRNKVTGRTLRVHRYVLLGDVRFYYLVVNTPQGLRDVGTLYDTTRYERVSTAEQRKKFDALVQSLLVKMIEYEIFQADRADFSMTGHLGIDDGMFTDADIPQIIEAWKRRLETIKGSK